MPIFEAVGPDGKTYSIEGPEGATQEQAYAQMKGQYERKQAGEADLKRMADPTGSFGQNLIAGVGKGMTDLGQGIGQAVGLQNRADVAEKRRIDAPLSATTGGTIGNVVGVAAPLALTGFAPGAATLGGASAIGLGTGALMPSESTKETLMNTGFGLAGGAGGQQIAKGIGALAQRSAAAEAQQLASAQAQNAIRDETLREAQKLGLAVPKSVVNPTFMGNRLESAAGKAAVKQELQVQNQQAVNEVARKHVGLPKDRAISVEALDEVRNAAAQPYRDIAAIRPEMKKALEELKQARFDKNENFQFYLRSGDPKARVASEQAAAIAEGIEKSFEEAGKALGKPDLMKNLRAAREKIAKTYDVEKALNVGSGDIDARILGRMVDKGRPVSGDLKAVGKFSEAFPDYAARGQAVPAAGVSKLESGLGLVLGTMGAAAGGPAGALAAGLPSIGSNLARSSVVRQAQKGVLPSYEQSALRRGMLALPQAQGVQAAERAGILALPPAYQ